MSPRLPRAVLALALSLAVLAPAQAPADASAIAAGASTRTAAPTPPPTSSSPRATVSRPPASSSAYRGRDHFWFPALGINQRVYGYACGRSTRLAHVVYRWGCANERNVYLMAHASSRFYALYDAHRDGRLRRGMLAVYADARGHVHAYRLESWRVIRPPVWYGMGWAIQAGPAGSSILTLQTCTGPNSSRRLMVRFAEVARP